MMTSLPIFSGKRCNFFFRVITIGFSLVIFPVFSYTPTLETKSFAQEVSQKLNSFIASYSYEAKLSIAHQISSLQNGYIFSFDNVSRERMYFFEYLRRNMS